MAATLYVADLDGTLLYNDATLSEFSRTHLNRLLDDGLAFTVASARSIVTIREVLDGLRVRLPVICFNGAFVSDLETGAHRIVHAIGPDVLGTIHDVGAAHGQVPLISTFDGERERVYYDRAHNDGGRSYLRNRLEARDERMTQVDDVRRAFGERVVSFTFIDRREALEPVVAELERAIPDAIRMSFFEDTYAPGWYWITVHDRLATKDQAIRDVMALGGCDGAEVVVFGDNDNDVPMFEMADRALAVENATANLKAHASEVIGPNESDSVVRRILADVGR